MRDVIAVILVAVLIVGGYFGYKAIFGGEEASPETVSDTSSTAVETQTLPQEPPNSWSQLQEETGQLQPSPATKPQEPVALPVIQDDPAQKLFEQARVLCSQNNTKEAATCLSAIISQYPDSSYSAPAAVTLAGIVAGTDRWTARNLYSFAFDRAQDGKLKEECRRNLDRLNSELVFSSTPSKDSEAYQIQPGDVLTAIAVKYNCPYRFIMQINRIDDPRSLRVGDRIKVLTGPNGKMEMRIVVDKSDLTLTVYLNNYYLKQYKVSVGRQDRTPVGAFTITERVEKPEWKGIKHGDPRNILGDYWLTLQSDKIAGLGIHGTNEPESIGKNESDGCVRMTNSDVKELYIMIPKGTQVIIQE